MRSRVSLLRSLSAKRALLLINDDALRVRAACVATRRWAIDVMRGDDRSWW